MEADQLGRLRDILEAARLIASYVANTTDAAFRADKQKQDAVIRRIEIIGEAAAHLTEETRRAFPSSRSARCAACATSWRTITPTST